MKKLNKTPFTLTLGATLLASVASTAAHAEFGVTKLNQGYMQLAQADTADMKKKEGSCGEAKCGANKKETKEMSSDIKTMEGKRGATKTESEMKVPEGKCGDKK